MNLNRYARRQEGFTLIELLVVILIIGVLAAIALPAFLNQRQKGFDSNAKSDARNLASLMGACLTSQNGYVGCSAELSGGATGLSWGTGPGQVSVTQETAAGYEIVAVSEAETGGVRHTFTITHNIGGVFDFSCAVAGEGGCDDAGRW